MGYDLVEVTNENDWQDYHAIRRAVLWEARGRSGYDDAHADEFLPTSRPLLLKLYRERAGFGGRHAEEQLLELELVEGPDRPALARSAPPA
jgi:hypothetical protein